MPKPRVIIFCFAGRRPNMELQVPLVRRILAEHPNVEYHVWNFARNDNDRAYVKTIKGPQITVFNQYGSMKHNEAYRTYAGPDYQDCLFVKIDDDVVFLETERFGKFVEAIEAHPGTVLSANTINNGASTPLEPGIWEGFEELDMHLLDIHMSSDFPDMAHTYFFEHSDRMLAQPIELIPTEDWLSINIVGYNWETMCRVLDTIGKPHPAFLADRPMKGWGGREGPGRPYGVFGDEGVFQILPRVIMKGFTAAHLTYGPQNPTDEQLERWRDRYCQLGQRYLESPPADADQELPELSAPSHAQGPYTATFSQLADAMMLVAQEQAMETARERWGPNNWRVRAIGENDPTAGRYVP